MGESRVRFLGSGDAFGSGGRFQTCIALEFSTARVLLDCGASSLIAMKRHGVDPATIEAILVTHLHGDHFGGIPFFVLDAQFARRTAPLTIAGPPGIEARVHAAMEVLFPGSSSTRQRFDLTFVELTEDQETRVGAAAVSAFAVVHTSGAPAYALRVSCEGRTVAYSGDTEWTPALLRAAAGADLFICEAYFYEKRVPFHLDYRTLAEQRDALSCRHLILTHLNQDMLDHRDAIDIACAEDGMDVAL